MKLNEKKGDRELEREIKTKEVFFVGRTTWKFCSGSEKKRIASGHHHNENEGQWKKSELEHVRHFLHKTCNLGRFWKFHVVIVTVVNNGKGTINI